MHRFIWRKVCNSIQDRGQTHFRVTQSRSPFVDHDMDLPSNRPICFTQYLAPYTFEQSCGTISGVSYRSNHSPHWNGEFESVALQT